MSRLENVMQFTGAVYEFGRAAITLAVVVTLIGMFWINITRVDGTSMYPNLQTGEVGLVDILTYRLSPPERGDIVNVRFPGDPEHQKYVKRIIGLPGDHIILRDGRVVVNGRSLMEEYLPDGTKSTKTGHLTEWQLAVDQYFLMGDNRPASNDSRVFGPVEQRFIIGKLRYLIWPPVFFKVL